jgi:hypothetical protein
MGIQAYKSYIESYQLVEKSIRIDKELHIAVRLVFDGIILSCEGWWIGIQNLLNVWKTISQSIIIAMWVIEK